MTMATLERGRRIARWLLAAFFAVAGVVHVARPGLFLKVTPDWVPAPETVILLTGLCELAGAAALFVPRTRRLAGIMLALYTVCVFPANIKHAWLHATIGMPPGWGYHVPRLMLQPVIVWWCLFGGGVINWPWRMRR